MILPANNKHEKHAKLVRALTGEWGRYELAILGTTCEDIKHLAYQLIQQFSAYNIGYADADHTSVEAGAQDVSSINKGAYLNYTNKISFTRLDIHAQPGVFQKKALLSDCDLMLVNGNHFTASKQIIVIDGRKPLEKKLDKLTDVCLILLKDSSSQIPGYITSYLPHIHSIPVLLFTDTPAIVNYLYNFIQQRVPLINGLVLAGGKSTRMGRDKGDIHYYDKPQRDHVYEILSGYSNETFISCNHEQAVALKENNPVIEDTFLNMGPLGGILSAFQRNPNVAWLAIACDLPFVTTNVVEYLVKHRNPAKMATAFMDSEGKYPEPLVTIWEPKAYPVLLQFLAQGYACPRKALINSNIQVLQAPDSNAFKNVNTAEEYNATIKALHSQ